MEGFKRKRSNSPLQRSMDQSTSSEEQRINQVAEDIAGMDLQYHPVDEPVPSSYEMFVSQLPDSTPAAAATANYEQPLPIYAFNQPGEEQPQRNGIPVDNGSESGRDDSGIEMGEPSENVVKRFVRTVHTIDSNGEVQAVHFCCGLCKSMFENVEQLHDHLIVVHRVRL